ncbi:MAG: 50S ribosomal protein L24 [Flavobacteriales bacterium]|nr:MAG: 50S ribosomal protein L24 [Flavobacteriales bacterium]
MAKLKIKSGDTVQIISGESKGQSGKVLKVNIAKQTAIVEGVNMVSKHRKPSAQNPQGGIEEMEAPVHISNMMLVENGKPVRVGYRMENGKKIRFSKKSDKAI